MIKKGSYVYLIVIICNKIQFIYNKGVESKLKTSHRHH
jgi:hypothetical protein